MSAQEPRFENYLSQNRCFLKYRHLMACSSNPNGSYQSAQTSSDNCHVKDWLGHDGSEGFGDVEPMQAEKRGHRAGGQHIS